MSDNNNNNNIDDVVVENSTDNKDKPTSKVTTQRSTMHMGSNVNSRKTEIKDDEGYEQFCSICNRSENVAGKMINLPNNMSVCNDCMQKSYNMMSDSNFDINKLLNNPNVKVMNITEMKDHMPKQEKVKKKKSEKVLPLLELGSIPAPHKIKEQLDDFVIGQDKAKKAMSVAVYNHYKRIATDTMDDIQIEKSNMMMVGPTGSGKTYLVRTLARLLDVPLAITDATSLTEAGYIGDDIESVLSKLLTAADNDVNKAEQGIVFIDEIDKIAKKKSTTHQRDVSGEAVQQGLLKILEGSDVEIPVGSSSKNAMVPTTTINTRNILFICGGAFPGLDEIIEERLSADAGIGFGATIKGKDEKDDKILEKAKVEDLRNYGMIPEFMGRLPIIFSLQGLSEDMLVQILKEPKNAILKQYQKLLELDEVKLEFSEDAMYAIAKKALEMKTGARGLRSVLEEYMLDIMYEIPKDNNIGMVTITERYIEGTGGPEITMRG